MTGGGGGAELRDVDDGVHLRVSGLHRAVRRCAVEVYKGSGWAEGHWRRGIAVDEVLTGGGSRV